VNEETVILYGG